MNEGQIATEAQLLTSRNSLRQVVQRCKLGGADSTGGLDLVVDALARDIKVTPLPKARERMATRETTGDWRRVRRAKRRLCIFGSPLYTHELEKGSQIFIGTLES